ncbi:MAG: hypothetical protein HZC26_03565 [Candidatus Magasanikbacteria bacterium]|nr:hypothetical protein [Candidatus Magasanikbacteria bacterium]
MTTAQINTILNKVIKTQKIGKMPVVVLPLPVWEEIQNRLEDMEMTQSDSFRKKIAKARSEKKFYSLAQVKKMLAI